MYSRRRPQNRRKGSAQVEQRHRAAEREKDERRRVAGAIYPTGVLEDLCGTGIDIRCAVEHRPGSLRGIDALWKVVVPACRGRPEAAKFIPAQGMWAGREVNARKNGADRKNERLRRYVAKCGNTWRFRELGQDG
jgi:hypothetical protein